MARIINCLFVFTFCISLMPHLVEAADRKYLTVTSEAGDLAYGVQRGEGATSVTEIWVVSQQDNRPTRIKTYPGDLGDLFFDPAGKALIYLERSLRNQVWASSYYGGQSLPIVKNGIWKLSLDGEEEDLWPLPEDFQPNEIALSPDGRTLAIIGYRGGFFGRIDNGLWISDKTGGIKLLFAGKVTTPVLWSDDGTSVTCAIHDESKIIHVNVATGEAIRAQAIDNTPNNKMQDRESVSTAVFADVMAQSDASEIVPGMIGTSLDLYIRGKNALHRGIEEKADQTFKNARNAFRRLYDKARKYGLSRKSCTRYIEACEFWIESKNTSLKPSFVKSTSLACWA